MISQNDIEYLQDMVEREQMTADEANVEKVLTQRVLIVKSLPKTVRAALNAAVRDGKLRHKGKKAENRRSIIIQILNIWQTQNESEWKEKRLWR